MATTNPGFETLSRAFFDADYARGLLEAIRWPDGPVCPHCGVEGEAYKLTAKKAAPRPMRPGVYKCATCRKQFTVTVGTIFEGSKVPLNKWIYAIHLMTCAKKGISAHQLHRTLKVQYKTAWFMNHRIRKAMEHEPLAGLLSGVVEADETYIGGKGTGTPRRPYGRRIEGHRLYPGRAGRRGPLRGRLRRLRRHDQGRHPAGDGPEGLDDDGYLGTCTGLGEEFAPMRR